MQPQILILTAVLTMAAAPAEVVVVRDLAAVAGCRSLGEVRGSSMLGGVFANAAYNNAVTHLKQATAALGGTHVQLIDSSAGFAGARMLGTAYSCARAAAPPQPVSKIP